MKRFYRIFLFCLVFSLLFSGSTFANELSEGSSQKEENTVEEIDIKDYVTGVNGVLDNTTKKTYKIEVPYDSDLYLAIFLGNSETLNEIYQNYYSFDLLDSNKKKVVSSSPTSYQLHAGIMYYQMIDHYIKKGTYYLSLSVNEDYFLSSSQAYTLFSESEFYSNLVINSIKQSTTGFVNKTVTFTPQSNKKEVDYQFSINNKVMQSFSKKGTFSWKPTKAGTYELKVEIRDQKYPTVIATKTLKYAVKQDNISISSLKANVSTPQPTKKQITFTSSAKGYNLQYSYQLYSNKKWTTVQKYSTKKSYTWKPSKAGSYQIRVLAKNKVTGKTASKSMKYTIFNPSSVSITSLKANKKIPSTIKIRSTYTFTVNAKGSYLEYRYRIYDSGKWKTVQNYGSKKSYLWKAAKKGTYQVAVDVRQKGSTKYVTKTIKNLKVK